jgi:hypothetical protein
MGWVEGKSVWLGCPVFWASQATREPIMTVLMDIKAFSVYSNGQRG